VIADAQKQAGQLSVQVETFESNHEGAIVDLIHAARGTIDAMINPAGFTHTSVIIRDALLGVGIPFVKIHVSNIYAREPWRTHSYFSDKTVAVICGLGVYGYTAALEFAAKGLEDKGGGYYQVITS
jgi:3-dehydroquinate dehydratase-2